MNVEIPGDMAPFVQRMVADGRYGSESDVLAEALRLLESQEVLRRKVQLGVDQLRAGQGVPAEEVFAAAKKRIAAIKNNAAS